ncbi:hypothetical protein [Micromonospora rubida]|nr:hypothetical protein [Micromonospora rubida]
MLLAMDSLTFTATLCFWIFLGAIPAVVVIREIRQYLRKRRR